MRHELSALGFHDFFFAQLDPASGPHVVARVAAEHRGAYEVWGAAGRGLARIAGRIDLDDPEQRPCVGDFVFLASPPGSNGPTTIERVLARRTALTRAAAGRAARVQVVAANVDRVFVVAGLDLDFNLRRIERALVRVAAGGAAPVVVLNKADQGGDVAGRVAAVAARAPGVPIHAISAVIGEGVERLRGELGPGETGVVIGSSGVGKSTLVNALVGTAPMRTGAVRQGDDRGRHVTTHRQLVGLPGGGLLIDTPGMRELALLDDEGLDEVFADVARIAEDCRFRDCRHRGEPGCAVEAAARRGELPEGRLEHLEKLEREAAASELRHDVRKRREAERAWERRADEARERARRKRGE